MYMLLFVISLQKMDMASLFLHSENQLKEVKFISHRIH